jgi:hypothetical protein
MSEDRNQKIFFYTSVNRKKNVNCVIPDYSAVITSNSVIFSLASILHLTFLLFLRRICSFSCLLVCYMFQFSAFLLFHDFLYFYFILSTVSVGLFSVIYFLSISISLSISLSFSYSSFFPFIITQCPIKSETETCGKNLGTSSTHNEKKKSISTCVRKNLICVTADRMHDGTRAHFLILFYFIWFVRLLAQRPLLANCASLG